MTIRRLGTARKMVDHYRKCWIIEDYFRTLVSEGAHVEDANTFDLWVMLKFTVLAAITCGTWMRSGLSE